MSAAIDLPARTEVPLLIAFCDLTRYAAQSLFVSDTDLAETMAEHYERVTRSVEAAGGKLVKFIGDASLIVFPAESADRGVEALLALKTEVDDWFAARRWECRLIVKAHFGNVVAGSFGGRFDVLGKEVNATAMLDSTGVALSVEAFRKLSPVSRKRFKKHTSPVTYIRTEDPHRFRRGKSSVTP